MFEVFKNAWKIEDLRKKLLFTVMIMVIFRLGVATPVPFLIPGALNSMLQTSSGAANMLGYLNMLTGGSFAQSTLFALSVTPYINASIILNLLTIAIPFLERLSKEGEEGQRKLTKITRYFAAVISFGLSVAYYYLLRSKQAIIYTSGFEGWFTAIIIVTCFTAGAMLIMWLGEQIDSKGIGNGISLLIFAGIISRLPQTLIAVGEMWKAGATDPKYYYIVPLIVVLTVLAVAYVVRMTNGERRIPVQYAKRVVGRKMYGGQSTHIPIKVNMSGVMPIIFASALVSIPGMIKGFLNLGEGFWSTVLGWFDASAYGYAITYLLLILAFNYFYVSIQYNPMELANQLRKNNGAIPGIRPGKPTEEYIGKVLSKITLLGALFLAVVAISPIILGNVAGVNIHLGGTSLLIIVGVALETSRQLESFMLMRHHKGFLE